MRFVMVLLAALVAGGCDYTTIYEYSASDGGTEDDAMSEKAGWRGNFGSSEPLPPLAYDPVVGLGAAGIMQAWSKGLMLVDITSLSGKPEPVLITLRGPQLGEAVSDGAQLIAFMQWGVDGVSNFAMLDFGQEFVVEAESVKIVAIQNMIFGAAFPPAAPQSPHVGASAAPGHTGGSTPPHFTMCRNAVLAAGANTVTTIPPFARGVRVAATPNTSAMRLDFGPAGFVGAQYTVVAFPSDDLAVPGALDYGGTDSPILVVNNVGVAGITGWRLIYELAL
jgi:hypothetical protein